MKRLILCGICLLLAATLFFAAIVIVYIPSIQKQSLRIGLSTDQMLEDYDFMWSTLEESYPFFPVLERQGVDVEKVKSKGRENMLEARDSFDYFEVLYDTIGELKYTGHVYVLDYFTYSSLMRSLLESKKNEDPIYSKAWLNVMQNAKSQENYELLRQLYNIPGYASYYDNENEGNDGGESYAAEDDIEKKIIIDDRVAYLNLPSFNRDIENDHKSLIEFYGEIADYEHLIIDIRNNGGGYNWYWQRNIVAPNIDTAADFYDLQLYKESERNKLFIDTEIKLGAVSHSIESLPDLPKINNDDVSQADKFIRFDQSVHPLEEGKKTFKGKIWLLTGPNVYSAAEMLCYFAKQTGFATLIGQGTGGDGPGVSPAVFALPNSGFIVQYSCSNGLNPDGSSNEEFGTAPDIAVPNDQDALNACISIILYGQDEWEASQSNPIVPLDDDYLLSPTA